MNSSLKFVICYSGVSLFALVLLALWPFNAERLLVIVPAASAGDGAIVQNQDQQIFGMLSGTKAQLLEKITANSFVVIAPSGDGAALIDTLYEKGAFLVLNAAGLTGCGEPAAPQSFRRNSNDRSR